MNGDGGRDPRRNTGPRSLGPKERQKEGKREQRRQEQRKPSSDVGWRYSQRVRFDHMLEKRNMNLHMAMDGNRDRDTYWNTGLNSLGPNEKQREGDREQGKQNQRGPSSDDG